METPLEKAIRVCGSQKALSLAIQEPQGNVWAWLNRGRVPAEYCPAIERATREAGKAVTCEELRPDLAEEWSYLRSTGPLKEAA